MFCPNLGQDNFFAAHAIQTNEDPERVGRVYLLSILLDELDAFQVGNLDFREAGSSEPGIGSSTWCSSWIIS